MVPDADRPVRRMLHSKAAAGGGVGVQFVRKGATGMAKAEGNGVYTTTDEQGRTHRFKVAKGDVIPDGATFVADEAEAVPKTKTAAKGPSETTASAGPSKQG